MARTAKGTIDFLLTMTALLYVMLNEARTVSSLVTPSAVFQSKATISTAIYSTSASAPNKVGEMDVVDDAADEGKESVLPLQDRFGVYKIRSPAQHKALLESNMDKLVVVKHFAPWCKACKRKCAICHNFQTSCIKRYDIHPWGQVIFNIIR